ncbi:RecBCD enzyme subunit RecB [Cutibacterium acnes]|nr:RecBCD enzyme subunit RecB [Cutibacterium acnes]
MRDKRELSRDVAVKYGEVPIFSKDDADTPVQDVLWALSVREDVRRRSKSRSVHTFDDLIGDLVKALRDPYRGPLACATLAHRFGLVMVDEFQDTDPLQWEILRRAFHGHSNLWLIGDPKQSIYAFRGADIHAYQDAAQSASHVLHLDVNYRTDKPIVEAVNTLFSNAQLGHDISMELVTAHHQESRIKTAATDGPRYHWSQPFQIRCLQAPAGAQLNTATSDQFVTEDLVNQVIMMLEGGTVVQDGDGLRPLRPTDIAILVRTRRRGAELATALSQAHQPAVFSGASPVWSSQAAEDLITLLEALENTDERLRTRLCLSDLIGATPADLAASDSRVRSDLAIDLARWSSTWTMTGVWGTVEAALHRPGVLVRLVSMAGGERYVTDLRQVAQKAHIAACEGRLTATATAAWIREQQQLAGDDEPRRLDSDQQAVIIMTIHEAKGLGFPVVLLPDITNGWAPKQSINGPIVWHDGQRRVLDISSQGTDRSIAIESHEEDERGENLRLLYVALTRARSAVRLWWSPCPLRHRWSAFQRLVEMDRTTGELGSGVAGTDPGTLPWLNSGPIATVIAPANQKLLTRSVSAQPRACVVPRTLTRPLDTAFARTSYSGLTANLHAAVSEPMTDGLIDEPVDDETVDDTAPGLCGLPGGTSFGTLVHTVLEYIDTAVIDLSSEVLSITRRALRMSPLPDVPPSELATSLEQVLHSDLGPLAPGMTLADFSPADRLAEMNFELAMAQSGRSTTMTDLASLLCDPSLVPPDDPISGYGEILAHIPNGDQALRGFLTGSIDAVLRRPDGRHLVVDYKTNRIPGVHKLSPHMYDAHTMRTMMFSSHYPLQGLLYSAALHRFLASSLPGYDPATHLGPIGYLFVRGMADRPVPDGDMPDGVFTWHPRPELIEAISERLGGLHD